MILLFHIVIALASIVYTTYLYVVPTRSGFRIANSLVAATLITGSILVFMQPAQLAQSCVTGLAYIAVVAFGLFSARHKLAATLHD